MKAIYLDFIKYVSSNDIGIQEVTNLEVNCDYMNYYYMDNEIKNSKVVVYGQVLFQMEYIEDGTYELKYIEFKKYVSHFINLNNSRVENINPIKKISVEDKGFRLLDRYSVAINTHINILTY